MNNLNILSETNELFDFAADVLSLEKDLRVFIKKPYREVKVELPFYNSDGKLCFCSGYRSQFNGARGPYYGALRVASDVNLDLVSSMAAKTTWKTAIMNIPFGGAYGGICIDNDDDFKCVKDDLVRTYTEKISSLIGPYKDIIAPGKNVDGSMMAVIMDAYSSKKGYSPAVAVGKPLGLSGTEANSNALISSSYYLLDLVAKNLQKEIHGQNIAIAAPRGSLYKFVEFLNYVGCNLVGVSDCIDALVNYDGIDTEELKTLLSSGASLDEYNNADKLSLDEFISVDADVLLYGNDSLRITSEKAVSVKADILTEIVDGAVCYEADSVLFDNGTVVIPDILITAGEIVVDYFEWIQNIQQFKWDCDQTNDEMAKYINESFNSIAEISQVHEVSYRQACYILGIKRVYEASVMRGLI